MRIINNPFGDVRGTVGGLVFSQNKAGAYVSRKRILNNKRTSEQINCRSQFSESSSAWKSLSPEAQKKWNSFSSHNFEPLIKRKNDNPNGHNAYTSLRHVISSSNRKVVDLRIVKMPADQLMEGILQPFSFDNTPPRFSVKPNLKQLSGPPATFALQIMAILSTKRIYLEVNINSPSGTNTAISFIDENDNLYTWRAYISEVLSGLKTLPANPLKLVVGTGIPVNYAPINLTNADSLKFHFFVNFNPKLLKLMPASGQIVRVTIAIVSVTGTITMVFSENVLAA